MRGGLSTLEEYDGLVIKTNHHPVDIRILQRLCTINSPQVLSPIGFTNVKQVKELYHKSPHPTLYDFTTDNPIYSLDEIVQIVHSCAKAAGILHEHKISHGDIHDANFFWDGEQAIIFDYNRSQLFGTNKCDYTQTPASKVRGVKKDCPHFPPEEYHTHAVIDEKYDIYGLGKLLELYCEISQITINRKLKKLISNTLRPYEDRIPTTQQLRKALKKL